jgi:hypothetical protein
MYIDKQGMVWLDWVLLVGACIVVDRGPKQNRVLGFAGSPNFPKYQKEKSDRH